MIPFNLLRYKSSVWKTYIIAGTMLFGFAANGIAQESPSGDLTIISPNAKLEKIFSEGTGFLEGPAMSPDGILYFTDIGRRMNAGHIWKLDPKTGKTNIYLSPSGKANGLIFDAEGRLIIAQGAELGARRIVRIDMKTGKSMILTATYHDLPFNAPNDVSIDEQGRIYFTDPSYFRYFNFEPIYQPVQGVYRIDPDSSVHLIIANAVTPNGVIVSPDQKTLYVTSADLGSLGGWEGTEGLQPHIVPRAILAYDLTPEGTAKLRSKLTDHTADGLAVDIQGNVYGALVLEKRIGIFSQEGNELASIPIPGGPTNVTFGRGQYNKTLFITSGKNVFMIKVLKEGYHLP